jgi:hypothetical protein
MNKSGQHLAAAVLELEKYLKKHRGSRRFELTFRWSAGHAGIGGNEDADKEAKAAARNAAPTYNGRSDQPPPSHRLVTSVPLQQSHHQVRPLRLVPALHGVQPLARLVFAKRL